MSSRFRPPLDVPDIGATPAEQQAFKAWLRSALIEIGEDLSAALSSDPPTVAHQERVDVPAGAQRRVQPPQSGMEAILPCPSPQNAGLEVRIFIENPAGPLTIAASPGVGPDGKVFQPTINGARRATYSLPGLVTLASNGLNEWKSTAEVPAETEPSDADATLNAALSATYHLQASHPSLPLARVATSSLQQGIRFALDYATPGQVLWKPGNQAAGSFWGQIFDEGDDYDVPRAWPWDDFAGDGLAYTVDIRNETSPFPQIITAYDFSSATENTSAKLIPMPLGRLTGDRIVLLLAGSAATNPWTTPADWALLGTHTSITHSGDVFEIILDGTNDPGSTLSMTPGVASSAHARVLLIRDSHPTRASKVAQRGTSGGGGTSIDVGTCVPAWGEANTLWFVYLALNSTVTISDFPDDFVSTGQAQMVGSPVGAGQTHGYGQLESRVAQLDATSWTHTASNEAAFTIAIPPRETGVLELSESTEIPAETALMNLFDEADAARAWDLDDFAGDGLEIRTSVGNGLFPEPSQRITYTLDTSAATQSFALPKLEPGQAVLVVIGVASTFTITVPTERPWVEIGSGATATNRCQVYWLPPVDDATAALETEVTLAMSGAQTLIVRLWVIDDHSRTQNPSITAASVNNTAGGTSNDIPSLTPTPGDGSLQANYHYIAVLGTAVDENVVSGFPASYTETGQTFIVGTTGILDGSLAYCERAIRGGSEDVAAFVYAAGANGRSVGFLVALIPRTAARMHVEYKPPVPPGEQGAPGEQGQPGPPGQTGAAGSTGAAGPSIQGDQGDQGDAGPPGATGATGGQGATGPMGPPGDPGDTGDQGVPGIKGDTGAAGSTGPIGPPGETGPEGERGPPLQLNPFPNYHSLAYIATADTPIGTPKPTPIPNIHGNVIWRHFTFEGGVNNLEPCNGFTAQGDMTFSQVAFSPIYYGLALRCSVPAGGSGYAHLGNLPTSLIMSNPEHLYGFRVHLELQTANAGDDYDFMIGFGDDISDMVGTSLQFGTNSLFFRTQGDGAGGFSWGFSRQSAGAATNPTGPVGAVGSSVLLEAYRTSGTTWQFYVNGVAFTAGSANVPTSGLNFGFGIDDDGGGAADFIVDIYQIDIATTELPQRFV